MVAQYSVVIVCGSVVRRVITHGKPFRVATETKTGFNQINKFGPLRAVVVPSGITRPGRTALHGNGRLAGLNAENEAVTGDQIVARAPRLRTGGAT